MHIESYNRVIEHARQLQELRAEPGQQPTPIQNVIWSRMLAAFLGIYLRPIAMHKQGLGRDLPDQERFWLRLRPGPRLPRAQDAEDIQHRHADAVNVLVCKSACSAQAVLEFDVQTVPIKSPTDQGGLPRSCIGVVGPD